MAALVLYFNEDYIYYMINILFEPMGEVKVDGDVIMVVQRKFSLNSKVLLNFIDEEKQLVLKLHYYTLIPFSKLYIDSQRLKQEITLSENFNAITIGEDQLRLQHIWHYFITGKLCNAYYNDRKIANVRLKNRLSGIIMKIDNFIDDKDLLLYLVIIIITKYSDLDGGD